MPASTEQRREIEAWMETAISLSEARARGYRQIGRVTVLRNWSKREELWAHRVEASQAKPVLVRMDERRGALFATV